MSEPRTARDAATRTATEREKKWMPPMLLPDPAPQDGYVFRWVRVSSMGDADPMNISSKMREGWEPVKASDHPEINTLGASSTRYPGGIEIGGLILCKMPAEFAKQRDAYYQQQAENQMKAVDQNFMRENDPRMPLFSSRQSEVRFGKGT